MKISKEKKEEVINLRKSGLNYSQIVQQTGVSKGSVSSICQEVFGKRSFVKLTPDKIQELQKLYDEIGSIKKVAKLSGISYDRLKLVIQMKHSMDKSNYQCVKDRRHKLKEELVKYKGGKCQVCGYDRCLDALDFHHLNPEEKDFGISSSIRSLDKLKSEADKCILVCCRCHREIHAGLVKV